MHSIRRDKPLPSIIVLMGPTASGKTALSIALAQKMGGEIISVDSALVYRGMNIGTAKPGMTERGGITHHLIDILDPVEVFSSGEFKARAEVLIAEIIQRGNIPILSGGTMLYFKALLNGLAELPVADIVTRTRLELQAADIGWPEMHKRLTKLDAKSAQRIHPNDPQRIQRALEVYEITGQPLSVLQERAKKVALPFQPVKLIIAPEQRTEMHKKIAVRFRNMLQQGFIDEVRRLYGRGDLSEKMPSIRAVGYRQVWAYLQGEYDYDNMVEKAVVATRQLAKRQFTWLRKETEAIWFNAEQTDLMGKVMAELEKHLAGG